MKPTKYLLAHYEEKDDFCHDFVILYGVYNSGRKYKRTLASVYYQKSTGIVFDVHYHISGYGYTGLSETELKFKVDTTIIEAGLRLKLEPFVGFYDAHRCYKHVKKYTRARV